MPTSQWQKETGGKWNFIFIFISPDSPDYTDQRNFFFSLSHLHLPSLSLFYRPPREILANQNSIDSQRLCLASPTINVKFRDAKTGTGVALTGSGFRWKREYLHVYSNCRFRREGSADLEGKGWKLLMILIKERLWDGWIRRLGFSEDRFVIFIQLNE